MVHLQSSESTSTPDAGAGKGPNVELSAGVGEECRRRASTEGEEDLVCNVVVASVTKGTGAMSLGTRMYRISDLGAVLFDENDNPAQSVGGRQLQMLNLQDCRSLVTLPERLGECAALQTLNLQDCRSLVTLPERLRECAALETLNLHGCRSLVGLPERLAECWPVPACEASTSTPTSHSTKVCVVSLRARYLLSVHAYLVLLPCAPSPLHPSLSSLLIALCSPPRLSSPISLVVCRGMMTCRFIRWSATHISRSRLTP